jgi:hypothetical protein
MTTLWVLIAMAGLSIPVQSFEVYPTQEACQAQIDRLPLNSDTADRRSRLLCVSVTIHDR